MQATWPTAPIRRRKMDKPTRRDEILAYIAIYVTDNHNAPSTWQIASHFQLNQKTIRTHLKTLKEEGRIDTPDGRIKLTGAEYLPPSLN